MAGTKIGGKKAAAKNLENNPKFYSEIGKLGVFGWLKNGRKPRGFAVNPELAKRAGALGGRKSKRVRREEKVEA